jgi:N-acetylglucosamine kinase-like BadF-type ATPase
MGNVIGVDGGGTKTTAVVVDDALVVRGRATTGAANPHSVGVEVAAHNIADAVLGALAAAGAPLAQVDSLCLCLAGLDTDLDLPVPRAAVAKLGYRGPALFENDVVGAWAGATEAQPGIALIAGTGATGLGMNAQGDFWRTDGWDYVLGDSGSGYAIGLAGIQHAIQALDGRAPPTPLVGALATAYGIADAEEMHRLWDSGRLGKLEIAAFAPHVSRAAQAGDAQAQAILARAGTAQAESAIAIVRRLGMERASFPVCLIGGVFQAGAWVLEPLTTTLAAVAPGATIQPAHYPPEVGAALLARQRVAAGDLGSWTLGTGQRRIHRTLRVADLLGG